MVSVDRLLQIVVEARAVGRLQRYLEAVRAERGLNQRELPVTGTTEKTEEVVRGAVDAGLLTVEELAEFVDEVEDTGGQHLFLFDLTKGHEDRLSEDHLENLFEARPRLRSQHFYEPLPRENWFWYRKDKARIVKQVRTAEYWDREVVEETEDRRVVVWEKVKRRATNSLWYVPNPGVEIRIDRVSSKISNELAASLLNDFLEGFQGSLQVETDLTPVRIWEGFREMALAKNETFMTVDEAEDPSVKQRISNRRERGTDVREHDSYDLDRPDWVRNSLNIYWRLPWDPEQKVHTILSKVTIGDLDYGKVFINAKVAPEELTHVISRIRHFAS